MIFTDIADVDRLLLLTIDEKSLFTMTHVNKNVKKFILDDRILKHKFINYKIAYLKVVKMVKSTYDYKNVYVCINIDHGLTIHQIKHMVPLSKNIKLINDYTDWITYKIHANEVFNSIEIIVNYLDYFDISKISKNHGNIHYNL
jgi:hypothetical protein